MKARKSPHGWIPVAARRTSKDERKRTAEGLEVNCHPREITCRALIEAMSKRPVRSELLSLERSLADSARGIFAALCSDPFLAPTPLLAYIEGQVLT